MAKYYANISGAANVQVPFNPYQVYTGNGNYVKLEYVGNITTDATSNCYVWKQQSGNWFSFEQGTYQQYLNLGTTTYVTNVDEIVSRRRKFNSDSLSDPAIFVLDNGTAILTFDNWTTMDTFSGELPSSNTVFFPSSQASNLIMDFYGFKVYGSGDTLLFDFVPDLSGSTKGLKDNVSGNFFSASDQSKITMIQMSSPLLVPNENIYRADLEVVKGYRSGSTINKAYRSGELIYYKLNYPEPTPPGPGPEETPLTFNITSDGTIKWVKSGSTMQEKTIQYKLNDGEWTSITSTGSSYAPSIGVVSGDTIQFKGDNSTYSTGSNAFTYFIASGATFTVSGNIMSLIDSTDFATATALTEDYALCSLFKSCTGLTDASNLVLPATTLTLGCYRSLFDRCSHLTSGADLPATTLAQDCYRAMFYNCSGLTAAPVLPATTLADGCYYNMFYGCTFLTTAPELSATTLAYQCCYGMFNQCNSLTTAPVLPATTLADSCYQYMFGGCKRLTTAPELPATTLVTGCYASMFRNCTALNYIKCLATDISAASCTSYWVSSVAQTGTFVTPSSTEWTTGTSGIPSDWTRVNA